jgi:DeoR family transcriptional regulator, ulaG and ulaABCDEF operon transcriptional repressor
MVDATKFQRRSSLILCPLNRVSTLITDDGIPDQARAMIEDAGIKLIVAGVSAAEATQESSSAA